MARLDDQEITRPIALEASPAERAGDLGTGSEERRERARVLVGDTYEHWEPDASEIFGGRPGAIAIDSRTCERAQELVARRHPRRVVQQTYRRCGEGELAPDRHREPLLARREPVQVGENVGAGFT